MLLACTGIVLAQQERTTTEDLPPTSENSQREAVKGIFHAQWGDPKPGSNATEKTEYVLVDDQGRERKLLLDQNDTEAEGGPLAFNKKRVKVEGRRLPDGATERLDVQEIDLERPQEAAQARSSAKSGEPAAQARVSGGTPWVTIGCKFRNSTESKPMGYFAGLMGTSSSGTQAPEIDHYWQELSFNTVNLTGSKVTPRWYTLPMSVDRYMQNGSPNLTAIANDCTAAADADVNFPSYYGINLMLSKDIGSSAWGGSRTLRRDGQRKSYGVTWLPTFAYGQDWVTHEMGHGYGLPHSEGDPDHTTGYNQYPYDSEWDVMSGAGLCGAKPSDPDPLSPTYWVKHNPYECIADHTISHHKDLLGWIASGRRYLASKGSNGSIDIENLAQPASGGYLMAKIPIGTSTTKFYTIEARRTLGYDGHVNGAIPGEAIVIHKVDTTLSRDARVVDEDTDNDNVNDAGAMWTAGEIYRDEANEISIEVIGPSSSGSGYSVRINGGS